ncbi:hypothetical protein VM1G_11813 [Cytospora mali]|uniref:Uncharacterized protein n=1 Tax=Cytospora mali TaxID=578113 RepID=A0A194W6Z0_CYTMA|nr:hypothetical protein VM1G_11813 [Valsa mali]
MAKTVWALGQELSKPRRAGPIDPPPTIKIHQDLLNWCGIWVARLVDEVGNLRSVQTASSDPDQYIVPPTAVTLHDSKDVRHKWLDEGKVCSSPQLNVRLRNGLIGDMRFAHVDNCSR